MLARTLTFLALTAPLVLAGCCSYDFDSAYEKKMVERDLPAAPRAEGPGSFWPRR